MKIIKLKMDNFVKFTDFEIEYDGKITHLIGLNGSGKTTVGLTAIWACLKGIAEKSTNGQLIGKRYRFIGDNKKTADLELTLFDEEHNAEIIIKNKISKDNNQITFDAPVGYKIDDLWVKNLFSVAFLSAKNFMQYSSKEQALLLGIDTSKFDNHIKELKQDYTFINRKISNAGKIKSVEKAEKVSISELLAEKEKLETFNTKQGNNENKIIDLKSYIAEGNADIDELLNDIENHKTRIKSHENELVTIEKPKELIDIRPILDKINNAEETNQKAMQYQNYLEKKAAVDESREELARNKQNQGKVNQEKIDYIKACDFGFKGVSVNDEGELLLNEKPIREPYFSKGEMEIIVAKLHVKANPGLKLRFIDDFELLDENNKERIIKSLLDNGFQIITAQVGDNTNSKENAVLLRECKKEN